MPLTVPASKPFVTDVPEGSFVAVCIGIYDLGTVPSKQYEPSEKVLFLFEIPDLPDKEGFPMTVNCQYSQSLNPKSNLYKAVVSWRGRGFGKGEMDKFSLKTFLGQPAYLLIVHNQGKGEKAANVYANVAQISALQKGVPAPKPSREPLYFDFADKKAVIPDGVPDFVRKQIEASPEWLALKTGRTDGGGARKTSPAPQSGDQAPAEIVGLLNEIGLAYPYNVEELDRLFQPDVMSQEDYDLLLQHSIPF